MKRILLFAAGGVLLAGAALAYVRWPHLPPAERGRRVAEAHGCFACHGPGGTRGSENAGRTDGAVPTFEGDLMMYAKSPAEVREWIAEGVSHAKAASVTWRRDRAAGTLVMPAYGARLSQRDLDDLTAFVWATSGEPAPEDGVPAHGATRAEALGCIGCHGPGGRLARPNPGSLKGYVPSWDGADFTELARDSLEFREWVEDGACHRLQANPLARALLHRAALRMPAYRRHLQPGDVEALWAYVCWIRGHAVATP